MPSTAWCAPPRRHLHVCICAHAVRLSRSLARAWDTPSCLLTARAFPQRMTGKEYDPNSDQPNNPNIHDWYNLLLCPYDVDSCGNDELGKYGNEVDGVLVADHATNQHLQYITHPCRVDKPSPDPTMAWTEACKYVNLEDQRRTMSCGLCGHLKRKLGPAPFIIEPPPPNDPGREHLYTANMDFHPFGAWLANDAGFGVDETVGAAHVHANALMQWRAVPAVSLDCPAAHRRSPPRARAVRQVRLIHLWKASNGEEMHGYLWQSLRLLAYDTNSLSGQRKEHVDEQVRAACELHQRRPEAGTH